MSNARDSRRAAAAQGISRRAFLALGGAALIGVLGGCAPEVDEGIPQPAPELDRPRTMDEIYASGHFNVGIYTDSKPLAYMGSKGSYDGYDAYFSLYIIEKTGLLINYVPVDPCNRYEALATNKVDVCLAEMSPADEAAGDTQYAMPLLKLQLGLVSPKAAPVTSPEQLGDGELIVCRGSYAEQYAAATWPDVRLRSYDTATGAYAALRDGLGVAVLDNEVCALAWLKGKGDFTLSMEAIGEPRLVGPAVAAGQDDLRSLMSEVSWSFIDSKFDTGAYNTYIKPNVGGRDLTRILCKGDEMAP